MKRLSLLLALACLSCGPVHVNVTPPPAPTDTFNVACDVRDADTHRKVAGALCTITGQSLLTNSDGYALLLHIFGGIDPVSRQPIMQVLSVAKTGYQFKETSFPNTHDQDVVVDIQALHFDPSDIPLEQLAAIRGAMWPLATGCNLSLPFGPRPGSPDNVIATGFMANYSADDQLKIVDCLKSRGYTHVVMGPLVDSDGYHGQYEAHDWRGANFDRFLDTAQFFWDHGLEPVVFVHPDGWTFEQTRDELTPLLSQPRAQRLIRIVVPTGWEPTRYGWSSCTWTLFFQWARQTLPNALVLVHSVNDTDGLVGTDERCDDNGKPVGEGWAREVPYLHGWLIQNGPYATSPADNPTLAHNYAAQFMASGDGAQQHSVAWHFAGNVGWPTTSAWGDRPILLYAGEVTAFTGYWNNLAESIRVQWGDLAVRSGAAGYLDGGTIAVR